MQSHTSKVRAYLQPFKSDTPVPIEHIFQVYLLNHQKALAIYGNNCDKKTCASAERANLLLVKTLQLNQKDNQQYLILIISSYTFRKAQGKSFATKA